MHLEGSFETTVPRAKVWEFLLNPTSITPCFPDLQSIEIVDQDTFKAKVKVGISVVKGTMEFDFKTTEKSPPLSAKLVGHGRGVGSTVDLETTFNLTETSAGTKVEWAADVRIGGIMSGLGSKLLDSASTKMVAQVLENLRERMKG